MNIQNKNKKLCERRMRRSISKAQRAVDENTNTKIPDRYKDFLVCTDASKEGLGEVLIQDGRVIKYISRKLRKHEENYVWHDLELLAIVYALRVWRQYLIERNFELKTDHCGLHHIFMQSDLDARQRRWSKLLIDYDFEISYLKGTVNRVVDVLSHRPHIFLIIPLQKNLREKILTTTRQ
jgi:hypothetical protein